MRYVLIALLTVHALLHVLGLRESQSFQALWVIASLALLLAALLLFMRRDLWWMVGACGLLLSQVLILMTWSSAKAGTIVNLLLAVPMVIAASEARFRHQSD